MRCQQYCYYNQIERKSRRRDDRLIFTDIWVHFFIAIILRSNDLHTDISQHNTFRNVMCENLCTRQSLNNSCSSSNNDDNNILCILYLISLDCISRFYFLDHLGPIKINHCQSMHLAYGAAPILFYCMQCYHQMRQSIVIYNNRCELLFTGDFRLFVFLHFFQRRKNQWASFAETFWQ